LEYIHVIYSKVKGSCKLQDTSNILLNFQCVNIVSISNFRLFALYSFKKVFDEKGWSWLKSLSIRNFLFIGVLDVFVLNGMPLYYVLVCRMSIRNSYSRIPSRKWNNACWTVHMATRK